MPAPDASDVVEGAGRSTWSPLRSLVGTVAVARLIWGGDGAWSSAYGLALVLVNFVLSAGLIACDGPISLGRVMMAAVLFGYLLRLGLIFLAVWLVKDAGWISLPALGATIIVTHLGLLVWELKYVAISLAYPGLKPHARPIVNSPPTTEADPHADQLR